MNKRLYRAGELVFYVRVPSSDIDIVQDVVENKAYIRENFKINPGDIVIDIGAQIGTFSVLTSSYGATVYAYEPYKGNYELLEENIYMNSSKVYPRNVGVMGSSGKKPFYIESFNYGGCNFYNNSMANPSYTGGNVMCTTLDDIYKDEHLDHCDFLKIDCQGAELEILKSFSHLDTVKKIALEYHGLDTKEELKNLLSGFDVLEEEEVKDGLLLLELKTST